MDRISVIICAHNEARWLGGCLHSVLAQTRPADEVVVVNNASSDETRTVAGDIAGVRVVDEPRKGLVITRETGRRHSTGDLLASALRDRNFLTGTNPLVAQERLRALDRPGVTNVRLLRPWRWRIGKSRAMLVSALTFERAGT